MQYWHETYQKQIDALKEANNQQMAVEPQVQLPPPPQVLVAPLPRPDALSPMSYFPT
jgi:hypothetical protein